MLRLLALLILTCAIALPAQAAPRARVQSGVVEGVERDGIRTYLSIPYAAPPTGMLRWRAPQPAQPWRGVRQATAFGPSCTQNISPTGWGPWTGEFSPQGAVSEDCLTLSVWTPATRSNARLPVMLWIPGGGFTDGGEASAVTNGEALARQGIVVVSINYRVAAFGMLAHSALTPELDGAVGNYALRDALAALQWVHANARAFGGDPNRITIAGQSAGGALVYALLDAPQAAGLFSAAIIQSFTPGSNVFPDRAAALATGDTFAEKLRAGGSTELQSASAEAVLRASNDTHFDLYVDDVLIRDRLGASLPLHNDVPILMGMTADEISWRRPNLARHRQAAEPYGAGYLDLYPASTDAEALDAALRADRDGTRVALERWTRAHARTSSRNVFRYMWSHTLPGPDAARYRAFHSAEVIYMFGSFAAAPQRSFTPDDHAMAQTMQRYWANFVRTGDPNGDGLPAWPREGFMELGDHFAPLAPAPAQNAAFFNAHYDRVGEYGF